jgi:AsmA protein
MRTVKVLGGVIGGVVALILLALLAVKLFVDPNRYKDRIVTSVKASTGRDLQLPGDIRLAVFPWVALELGPASLGSPAGFGTEPFLSVAHVAVRVKLLPLLRKQLEVARVELDGVDINLAKNPAGQGNWQMSSKTDAPAAAQSGGSAGARLDSIESIRVTNGRIRYGTLTLDKFNLETGSIADRSDVPVAMGFALQRGMAGERFDVSVKLNFNDDAQAQILKVAALNLSGTWTRAADERPVHWEFGAPLLSLNFKQQTLSAPGFTVELSTARLTGSVSGTAIADDGAFTGALTLAPVVLRELAPRIGIALPPTKDARVLSSLSAETRFAYDSKGITLDDLVLKLDDTSLKGNLRLATGTPQSVRFEFAADGIDLDRYRPPEGSTAAAGKSPATAQSKPDAPSAPMNIQGTFSLGAARVAGLDFTALKATIDSQNGLTRLSPTVAQLYGGSYAGDVTWDARTATPTLSLETHLTAIDAAKLVQASAARGRLSGKANVNLAVTAHGAGADEILKTLNGHFDAALANGAIEGLDLTYAMAIGQSLVDRQPGPTVSDTHRTPFDAFKMSAQIANGVVETRDLAITSATVKISGQGRVNLPSDGIDMTLLASVFKSATVTAVDIPLKVTGKYSDPTVRPDVEAVAKGAIKQKLQDVLKKNGLQGLFGH